MGDEPAAKQEAPFDTKAYLIAEYTALRGEIVKRIEIEFQLLSLTLIIAGTFLSIGLQGSLEPAILSVYPPLSMFLAAAYSQFSATRFLIAIYTREYFEPYLPEAIYLPKKFPKKLGRRFGWEKFINQVIQLTRPWLHRRILAARGIFLGTQLSALALFLRKFVNLVPFSITPTPLDEVLAGLDVFAIVITFVLLLNLQNRELFDKLSPDDAAGGK